MSKKESELREIQKRFLKSITEPIHGESRERSSLNKNDGENSTEFLKTATELITPSKTLKPEERLELYHRQYWFRLLDSISEDFEILRAFLGDEKFWQLIENYLLDKKSQVWNLNNLGEKFSEFILANSQLTEPFTLPASEIARVEYAHMEIFEEANDEKNASGEDLLNNFQNTEIKFSLIKALIIIELETQAYDFISEQRSGELKGKLIEKQTASEAGLGLDGAENSEKPNSKVAFDYEARKKFAQKNSDGNSGFVLIWRNDFRTYEESISSQEATALEFLRQQKKCSLLDIFTNLTWQENLEQEEIFGEISDLLSLWGQRGILCFA